MKANSLLLPVLLALASVMAHAGDTTPQTELTRWQKQANVTGSAVKGQQFFTSTQGREWSCSGCHGAVPKAEGKHASTGKPIAPLAPAFNPDRFTDIAKTDKWFRRNCNDVAGRECTAAEKADVLAFLISINK